MIKHCPTRWLSLKRCVARVIEQHEALKSYFGSQGDVDRPRSKSGFTFQRLSDPLLLPWMHFITVFLEPFYNFNMKFQVNYVHFFPDLLIR